MLLAMEEDGVGYSSLEVVKNHADIDPSGLVQGMMCIRIPSSLVYRTNCIGV